MKAYLYETHLHTSEGSACGKVRGAAYIDHMISRGYDGMIVTDHFFNGNCAIIDDLPWDAKVARYMEGYRNALAAAEGRDFDVLFGVEFNFEGDEYLLYGVDERWLLENEDIMWQTRREVYRRVHSAGAVMVHAHPYRERFYLSDIKLTPGICDGIEVYNAANADNQNALAYRYATELGLPMTAGSDIHYYHDKPMGGVLLPQRIGSASEYADILTGGGAVPVRVMNGSAHDVRDIEELTVPSGAPTMKVFRLS